MPRVSRVVHRRQSKGGGERTTSLGGVRDCLVRIDEGEGRPHQAGLQPRQGGVELPVVLPPYSVAALEAVSTAPGDLVHELRGTPQGSRAQQDKGPRPARVQVLQPRVPQKKTRRRKKNPRKEHETGAQRRGLYCPSKSGIQRGIKRSAPPIQNGSWDKVICTLWYALGQRGLHSVVCP